MIWIDETHTFYGKYGMWGFVKYIRSKQMEKFKMQKRFDKKRLHLRWELVHPP